MIPAPRDELFLTLKLCNFWITCSAPKVKAGTMDFRLLMAHIILLRIQITFIYRVLSKIFYYLCLKKTINALLIVQIILLWVYLDFVVTLYILESLKHKLLHKLSYMDSLLNYLKISQTVMAFILGFSQRRFKCNFLLMSTFGHFSITILQNSPSS